MVKIFVHFLIYVLGSPSSYMTLHPIPSEFPYIYSMRKILQILFSFLTLYSIIQKYLFWIDLV
jgi:hypothetical protein